MTGTIYPKECKAAVRALIQHIRELEEQLSRLHNVECAYNAVVAALPAPDSIEETPAAQVALMRSQICGLEQQIADLKTPKRIEWWSEGRIHHCKDGGNVEFFGDSFREVLGHLVDVRRERLGIEIVEAAPKPDIAKLKAYVKEATDNAREILTAYNEAVHEITRAEQTLREAEAKIARQP